MKNEIFSNAICPVCGTPFVKKRINQRYCSDMCYLSAKYDREMQKLKNKTHNTIFDTVVNNSINTIISNHIPFSNY